MQHSSGVLFRLARPMILLALCGASVARSVLAQDVCPNPVVDDRAVRIASAADAVAVRERLIQFIWNRSDLPADTDVSVIPGIASPIACSVAIARVDELRMTLGPTSDGRLLPARAYHFVPLASRNRLAIVHDGHMPENACSTPFADAEDGFSPYGLQMAINALLAEGFDVLAVPMPLFQPDDCSQDHNALFDPPGTPAAGGSALRYFFDPVLRSLNYLLERQAFTDVAMTGLSGGGWTTTVYAALDPRITTSFPVAGSLPLWMRNPTPQAPAGDRESDAVGMRGLSLSPAVASCGEFGDRENSLPAFYQIAGYPELYVLGAYGRGRRQIQILNRHDACCFGQDQHRFPASYDADVRGYERDVRSALRRLGAGEFRVEIDEAATSHMISRNAVHNLILGELAGAHRNVGTRSTANVFKRGFNGTLWRYARHGWQDLGIPVIGAPAALENALHPIDVVARGEANEPLHVYYDGAQWHSQPMAVDGVSGENLPGGRIVTDPVIGSASPGEFEVVAQGSDFRFYRWIVSATSQALEAVGGNGYSVGQPALAHLADGRLGIYYRSAEATAGGCIEQPRVLYQLLEGGAQAWQPPLRLGGLLAGYPSASTRQGVTRVFSIGTDGALQAALSSDGAAWQWDLVDVGIRFTGRPSHLMPDPAFNLFARSFDDGLVHLTYADGWTATPLNLLDAGAKVIDAPVAVDDGSVYWTGADGQVWRYDETTVRQLSDDVLFQDAFEP